MGQFTYCRYWVTMIRSGKKTRLIFGVVSGLVFLYGSAPQEEPQMVDLNVVALDSHGQAVTDLTRDELRVTDNGKPQTIAFFRHRDSSLGRRPYAGSQRVFQPRRGQCSARHADSFRSAEREIWYAGSHCEPVDSRPGIAGIGRLCVPLLLDAWMAACTRSTACPVRKPSPPRREPPRGRSQIKPLLNRALRVSERRLGRSTTLTRIIACN